GMNRAIWIATSKGPPPRLSAGRGPPGKPSGYLRDLYVGVEAPLLTDRACGPVAAKHKAVVRLAQQLAPNALQQSLAVAVGEVRATDRAGEQGVAREKRLADLQRHPARAVAGRVEHLELEGAGAVDLTGHQLLDVLESRQL